MKNKKKISKFTGFRKQLTTSEHFSIVQYSLKWLLIATIVGGLVGTASAIFLVLLENATNWREENIWIIALLPLGGLMIGLVYHYWGRDVEAGNNILIEEIHHPKRVVPFKMAPLVFFGTVATHFFGGSAGREGTAVQMGGSIADQLTYLFRLHAGDRKILIITGICAGFASVFGTPLAGAIFGLEVFFMGRIKYDALFPGFLAAILADYITTAWGVGHIHYEILVVPELGFLNILYAIIAGICFGLTAMIFANTTHSIGRLFKENIKFPPLRLFIGGIIVAAAVFAVSTTKYIGLGIPTILDSFSTSLPPYDFAVKLIFTAVTLGAGFKGGEVTPLFFIGATLGNALALVIPLPMALLAGMGFVAVFSGAANTPLATTIMAIELFGLECGIYAGIACVVSYLFSGHSGIYTSQVIGHPKHERFSKEEGQMIASVKGLRRTAGEKENVTD
ncbi:MAG: voltage-gated chloride channel family protein [Bacteroidota bacterium]|nr:voltage-gated chloride channel family protein [Bacteroidota bacterium]